MEEKTNAQETTEALELEKEAGEIVETIQENVPAEKQEELLSRIQKFMQGDAQKELMRLSRGIFHQATPRHGFKSRGVGITRKDKSQSKKARLQSKKSRKANRGK